MSLAEAAEADRTYWWSKTPEERLAALELMPAKSIMAYDSIYRTTSKSSYDCCNSEKVEYLKANKTRG